jgi:phosphoribosylformylglycinamidine cyclo-ligase
VEPGDVILGLASSGVHSNGFSLIRRVLVDGHEDGLGLARLDLGGCTLAEELMTPTRIYVKSVLALVASGVKVKAMSHITGGGITENLDRCLPDGVDAVVHLAAWPRPRVFTLLADAAHLGDDEMLRTFNMGIGMCVVLAAKDAAAAAATLRSAGETVYEIGEIVAGSRTVRYA